LIFHDFRNTLSEMAGVVPLMFYHGFGNDTSCTFE